MYELEKQIVDEAFQSAKEAADKFVAQHGESAYCGFAWVVVRPGNSKLAKYIKVNKFGDTGTSGGVTVWNPSKHCTQSMDIKEAGAIAFANVLMKYGYKASAMSRPD